MKMLTFRVSPKVKSKSHQSITKQKDSMEFLGHSILKTYNKIVSPTPPPHRKQNRVFLSLFRDFRQERHQAGSIRPLATSSKMLGPKHLLPASRLSLCCERIESHSIPVGEINNAIPLQLSPALSCNCPFCVIALLCKHPTGPLFELSTMEI